MSQPDRPAVAIAMPTYGDISPGAANAYWAPSAGACVPRRLPIMSFSLTPHCFNHLFRLAMDLRDAGGCTHFAMIHSDIEPTGPWLDVLLGQMEARGLDLVSAVVPIKSDEGHTSTAIGDARDPWVVNRYVNVADRPRMAETFAGGDVCFPGEVLLVNTGLFVADLRRPWWDDFAFQIHTRIHRDESGRRIPQVRPEDWEMSRHLHEAGATYGATWAVPVSHKGSKGYINR